MSLLLVAARELDAARGAKGRVRGYLPNRWPRWFQPKLLDRPNIEEPHFERAWKLTADGAVRIVATPGHTAGHLSVIVNAGRHSIFLAGDTSYTQSHLVAGSVDGVASMGAGEDAAADTLRRIRRFAAEEATVYLPSHDPEAAARLAERRLVQPAGPKVG